MPRLDHAPLPTPIGRVWLSQGVMHHRLDPGTTVTETLARLTVEQLADFAGGRRMPAVVDIRNVKFADRAARDVFSQDLEFESATAIVVSSGLTQSIGNLYLGISRPVRPTRLFMSIDEATEWAGSFIS